MKEFIISALPFVIIGICLALIFANYKKDRKGENYLTDGLCIGTSLGIVLATSLKLDLSLCISLGMLVGLSIGSLIKKK